MGYRSDVTISIYNKDFKTLCEQIKTQIDDEQQRAAVVSLIKNADIDIMKDENNDDNSIVTMVFQYIKWYEGYTDVDYIMNFLHSDERRYSFKRIGEDTEDIEEECNDDEYNLSEVTDICVSFQRSSDGTELSNKDKDNLFGSCTDGEFIDSGMTFDDIGG